MKAEGHVFRVSTSGGQRSISYPRDLIETHKSRLWENILQGIGNEQVAAGAYGVPGAAKVLVGRHVYYTIFEKILDYANRPVIAAHAMVFSLDALSREAERGRTLLLPNGAAGYKDIVMPSMVHDDQWR